MSWAQIDLVKKVGDWKIHFVAQPSSDIYPDRAYCVEDPDAYLTYKTGTGRGGYRLFDTVEDAKKYIKGADKRFKRARTFNMNDKMDFSDALRAMRRGKAVMRNGDTHSDIWVIHDGRPCIRRGNAQEGYYHIAYNMHPSDIMAEDWEVVV